MRWTPAVPVSNGENRYRPASGPVSLATIMSQLPELDPGVTVFCVVRSAIVTWLQPEPTGRVIGVASAGSPTGLIGPAEAGRGVKFVWNCPNDSCGSAAAAANARITFGTVFFGFMTFSFLKTG